MNFVYFFIYVLISIGKIIIPVQNTLWTRFTLTDLMRKICLASQTLIRYKVRHVFAPGKIQDYTL